MNWSFLLRCLCYSIYLTLTLLSQAQACANAPLLMSTDKYLGIQ